MTDDAQLRASADGYDVLVNGAVVGHVRKRSEIYTGIARGGTYHYWDAVAADGRRVTSGAYQCPRCDGEVHTEIADRDRDPFALPQCTACGHRFRGDDHPVRLDGWRLTTDRGRYARTSVSTRRDAVHALLTALEGDAS